ncbi:MAG: WecB/TagA/CpsF family glycosyltransferase [Pikeienuella sp.]
MAFTFGSSAVRITTPTAADLFSDLVGRLSRGEGFAVATLNLDHLVKLRRSERYRRAYAAQTHVVADGNPSVWLARLAGERVDLVPGADLMTPLLALAAERGVPVAFCGATEETLARSQAALEAAHGGLRVVSRLAPSFPFDPDGPEADAVIAKLGSSGARLCLLALGAPRQEILAARAHAALPHIGFVSIGAGLDFAAGTQRRAPVLFRRMALEWLWRALQDPRRLGPRYLACALILPSLTLAAVRHRLGRGSAPAAG